MRSRMPQSIVARLVLPFSMLALLMVGGCFNPNGGVTGYFAYISTPMAPKTVAIYDMRTGEPFFVQEVPVGKQLNFRFLADGGDDPLYSPSRLQWGIGKAGDNAGQLDNQLTCPPEEACRIQVELRKPEQPVAPDSERYRVDAEDRPNHLTPDGGQLPSTYNRRIYE